MTDDRDPTSRSKERAAAADPGATALREEIANLRAQLADQAARLNALGAGREETMRTLSDTRRELSVVRAERDRFQKQLASLGDMQTETIALTDDDENNDTALKQALPSLDELMANLGSLESAPEEPPAAVPVPQIVDPDASEEMIAPELVFPEGFGSDDEGDDQPMVRRGNGADGALVAPPTAPAGANSRLLVFLDADPPIKYPLYKTLITIGRSEAADVRIDGDYISRVHARIVTTDEGHVVEDIASKNGIKVNSRQVKRHVLRHGDVLSLGKLHFTFIDTAAAAGAE